MTVSVPTFHLSPLTDIRSTEMYVTDLNKLQPHLHRLMIQVQNRKHFRKKLEVAVMATLKFFNEFYVTHPHDKFNIVIKTVNAIARLLEPVSQSRLELSSSSSPVNIIYD